MLSLIRSKQKKIRVKIFQSIIRVLPSGEANTSPHIYPCKITTSFWMRVSEIIC